MAHPGGGDFEVEALPKMLGCDFVFCFLVIYSNNF